MAPDHPGACNVMKCLTVVIDNLRLVRLGTAQSDISVDGAAVLLLACIEEGDANCDARAIACRVLRFAESVRPSCLPQEMPWPLQTVVIMPFSHLSEFGSNDKSHIASLLRELESHLSSGMAVVRVSPDSTRSLFADLALFDTSITSRLCTSRTSLLNQLKALLRVFSYETVSKSIVEAKEENEHGTTILRTKRQKKRQSCGVDSS